MMFDLFTDRARRVILYAKEEAERLMQPGIDTEHMLVGLLREKTGLAAEIFNRHGLPSSKIIDEIRSASEDKGIFIFKGSTPFSPMAKNVIDIAVEESKIFGSKYVNTEHLLLALLREREGKAFRILLSYGIDRVSVNAELKELLTVSNSSKVSLTPLLDEFGRDLTALARAGRLDNVIGRENEINRLIQILLRRQKNNAVLLGEPGVGKTAIVEGLASRMIEDDISDSLRQKHLISLELGAIVAGTKYRGQFEERMKNLLKEIESDSNTIIFIDEIHTIIGAGAAEGSLDAANMIKPALAKGKLQCIGATTLAEYRRYFEKDGALVRRFQTVLVNPSDDEQTIKILKGVKKYYESYHNVNIPDDVLEETVSLTDRYITDKFQPDKSIDVIDEACAKHRLRSTVLPEELRTLRHKISQLEIKREKAVSSFEYDKVEKYIKLLGDLSGNYNIELAAWRADLKSRIEDLDIDDVTDIVSIMTGVPAKKLKDDDKARVAAIDKELARYVVGQEEAISNLSKAIKRSFAGLSNPARPIGSFIFLGPTGVGKTEVAKRLAQMVFGSMDALIRIDMSEFMEKFNVSRLVGAPPGYVGYAEGGKLTEQVRRRPYCVVLFDEVEKAHPDVMNVLLQILDEGFITDSLGHKVNFKNTIIILTSNIGTKKGTGEKLLGFAQGTSKKGHIDYKMFRSAAERELKEHFSPEFLNRLDNIIYFNPLGIKELKVIIDMQIDEINERLKKIGKRVELDEATKEFLLSNDYPFMYGARPIKRLLQSHIEDKLSDILINDKKPRSKVFKTTVNNDEVVIV